MTLLQAFSLPDAIDAGEANMAAAYAALYMGWDEAQAYSGPDVVWGLTRVPDPMINNATRVRFAVAGAETALAAIVAAAQARGVPMRWWLGPGTAPAGVKPWLLGHGFRHVQLAGMALDLASMPAPAQSPALRVGRVADAAGRRDWCRVLALGFDVSQAAAAAFGRAVARLGLDAPDWHLYIAYLDREPVAVSSMYLGEGVAGIYNVAALPAARGQGAGSAVSYAALQAAAAAGYRIATLQASRLGYGVYRRLGFVDICPFDLYIWSGDGS